MQRLNFLKLPQRDNFVRCPMCKKEFLQGNHDVCPFCWIGMLVRTDTGEIYFIERECLYENRKNKLLSA